MAAPSGVERVVKEAIAERGDAPALQPGLFAEAEQQPAAPAVENRGGRPVGARNRRTEEYARFLRARHGDPLDVATAIAARNITAAGELENLAFDLGMKPAEAADFWLRTLNAVLPYLHQRMPQAVVLNRGAPGGDRIELELVDEGDGTFSAYDDEEGAA